MTRRCLLLVLVPACLLVAAFFAWRMLRTPQPGVTFENFERLHERMTMEEIEAILGNPPSRHDYARTHVSLPEHRTDYWISRHGGFVMRTETSFGYKLAFVAPDGTSFLAIDRANENINAKIQRLLGLTPRARPMDVKGPP